MFGSFNIRTLRPVALGAAGCILPLLPITKSQNVHAETLSSKEFQTVTCVKNEQHTHDTRKVTFKLHRGSSARWTDKGAIANVCLRITDSTAADGVAIRCYNPLSAYEKDETFTLLVKKYKDAKMGTAVHALKEGDTMSVKGPNQQWTFAENKYAHYGFVAGGTGITPIIQAIGTILQKDEFARITLVCFNKTEDDVLLNKEIERLRIKDSHRVTVHHVVEKKKGGLCGFFCGWKYKEGKPSVEILKKLLPPPKTNSLIMVCGRKPMLDAVCGPKNADYTQGEVGGYLQKLGYTKAEVWKI